MGLESVLAAMSGAKPPLLGEKAEQPIHFDAQEAEQRSLVNAALHQCVSTVWRTPHSTARDETEKYLSEMVTAIPLFVGGRRGYVASAILFGLNEAKAGDSAANQLSDLGFGCLKGTATKYAFEKIGARKDFNFALKGMSMGASSRALDVGLTRQTWLDEKGSFQPLSGAKTTIISAAHPASLATDVLTFGIAHGGIKGANWIAKGAIEASPRLTNALTGTAFGFTSGSLGELQRQMNDPAETFDPLKILARGGASAATMTLSASAGYQLTTAARRQPVVQPQTEPLRMPSFARSVLERISPVRSLINENSLGSESIAGMQNSVDAVDGRSQSTQVSGDRTRSYLQALRSQTALIGGDDDPVVTRTPTVRRTTPAIRDDSILTRDDPTLTTPVTVRRPAPPIPDDYMPTTPVTVRKPAPPIPDDPIVTRPASERPATPGPITTEGKAASRSRTVQIDCATQIDAAPWDRPVILIERHLGKSQEYKGKTIDVERSLLNALGRCNQARLNNCQMVASLNTFTTDPMKARILANAIEKRGPDQYRVTLDSTWCVDAEGTREKLHFDVNFAEAQEKWNELRSSGKFLSGDAAIRGPWYAQLFEYALMQHLTEPVPKEHYWLSLNRTLRSAGHIGMPRDALCSGVNVAKHLGGRDFTNHYCSHIGPGTLNRLASEMDTLSVICATPKDITTTVSDVDGNSFLLPQWHANSVLSINPDRQTVTVLNPWKDRAPATLGYPTFLNNYKLIQTYSFGHLKPAPAKTK
ncbi:MAG TPA: hypothetical protein V6C69_02355 [Trichormus sp.]